MHINFSAPLNGLGYGVAGQNILSSLLDLGHNVALFHIPSKGSWAREDIPEARKRDARMAEEFAKSYDPYAPSVRLWMQDDLALRVGRGLQVGFPFFELTRFSLAEEHSIKWLERLFVASEWAKRVIEDNGLHSDVHVVPLGVDRDIFNEDAVSKARPESDHTVFVNVGKWEIRKGHDALLIAFNKAFTPQDKVLLRVAAYNPFIGTINADWAARYKGSPMGEKIELINRLSDQKMVARLLADSDCGVYPARAEGWNLDLLETLSVGTHAIATYYSAHTQYLDDKNCRLIEVSGVEPARDGIWFHGQGDWAKFEDDTIDQLVEHMREVHRLKQTGALGRNDAGIETAKFFSWRHTAENFVQGLQ